MSKKGVSLYSILTYIYIHMSSAGSRHSDTETQYALVLTEEGATY